jgi:hypothetical protein
MPNGGEVVKKGDAASLTALGVGCQESSTDRLVGSLQALVPCAFLDKGAEVLIIIVSCY